MEASMGDLWFAAAWIVMGLIWLRRAYIGQKPAALTTVMARPEDLLMQKRERTFAVVIGLLNFLLGVANIWRGFHHR
jgi:hypothetical protein